MKIGYPVRKRRRVRGARSHYVILQCPHCDNLIVSAKRVRHTYLAYKRWLRSALALQQRFTRDTHQHYKMACTQTPSGTPVSTKLLIL